MRTARFESTPRSFPGRRLRVLVEDPAIPPEGDPRLLGGVDVTTCSGPVDHRESCPLVASDQCPFGSFDVVVSALGSPWGPSVRGAWEASPTPLVPATEVTATDPEERLAHHVAAALQHLAGAPSAFAE